ncbi:hypothetical protein [Pontibacillus salipaludis]|uniref:Yip1 domain-containing protein n=1 Tax=Pontibacillus salipaludis TaxID=1697394 RepID=A0ABQ1QKC7_9BACI|nr:hypothetical protein [Pontibacillus salipaludis]GGD29017.1 hypothetical protein GCM10011389_40760 [Pontibacillus salipaludis]
MLKSYNLLYYYGLLFNLESGFNKLSSQIQEQKVKNIILLIQVSILSGLVALYSTYLNTDILENLTKNESDQILYIISFAIGSLAPIGTILAFFIFLNVASKIQVVEAISTKRKIFSISIIAYLPILIGSLVNLCMVLLFGVSDYGYTTAYGIFRPENKMLISLSQEIDPFKFLGVYIAAFLYQKLFNKGTFTLLMLILSWYVISGTFILIAG